MKNITENILASAGLVILGFLIGVFAVASALDNRPAIKKDANGLHVSYDGRLFRLNEMK